MLKKSLIQFESIKKILETLEAVKQFIYTCCSKEVREGWGDAIEDVSKTWSFLHEHYNIQIPNKVHIIMDHVGDYIEMTGKSLGRVSDQIVECAHSALHRRLSISNYWVKNKETDVHGIKLFRGIVHFNSYNI